MEEQEAEEAEEGAAAKAAAAGRQAEHLSVYIFTILLL
jgi:hypothetical protein